MRRDRTPPPPTPEPWNPQDWPDPAPEETAETPDLPESVDDSDLADDGEFTPPNFSSAGAPPVVEAPWETSAKPEPVPELRPSRPGRRPPRRRRAGLAIAVLGLAARCVVGVAGLVVVLRPTDSTDTADGPSQASAPATDVATAPADSTGDADCPSTVNGRVTTGRDAGDQTSGAGVIKAFDHAYYVRRDGAAARALGTPSARVGTAKQMQTYIDQLPAKTRHCLTITDERKGLYTVELSEIPPGGGAPTVFRQRIQTTTADGKSWIVSIESLDE